MDDKDTHNVPQKSLLEQNASFAFTQAKAERLATAVYLISQFIPESEPLRTAIRTHSLELISRSHAMADTHTVLLNSVLEIISLLNVAYRAGYVSEMNWSIIRGEHEHFASFLRERAESLPGHGTIISKKIFETGIALENVKRRETVPEKSASLPSGTRQAVSGVKDKKTHKGHTEGQATDRKDERRKMILDLLKKQERITVRDVAGVIPGVSEKTLQRELSGLVEEGVLKREGERRWSTYFLA